MVKMNHVFRPKTLDDIVGQPIDSLKLMMTNPRPSSWMLVGAPGTGKTITTRVVASMLGCDDEYTGLHHIPCTSFGIEQAKQLFNRDLRFRSLSGWHLVVLEECEWLSPQVQRFLKDALDQETNMPSHTIVLGTSNTIDELDEAMIERFRIIEFSSNKQFAHSCLEKIRSTWQYIMQRDLPANASTWGWKGQRFSMRLAIQEAEKQLEKELAQC